MGTPLSSPSSSTLILFGIERLYSSTAAAHAAAIAFPSSMGFVCIPSGDSLYVSVLRVISPLLLLLSLLLLRLLLLPPSRFEQDAFSILHSTALHSSVSSFKYVIPNANIQPHNRHKSTRRTDNEFVGAKQRRRNRERW